MKRRQFLIAVRAATAILTVSSAFRRMGAVGDAKAETFEVTKTEAEWRASLRTTQFAVLRQEDTERPGTSPLLNEKRKGTFHCAGCDLPVYPSETKYESGTGWPSFWDSLPDAIGIKEDNSLFMARTECTAAAAAGISAISSMTARSRPANVTASTAWRSPSSRRRRNRRSVAAASARRCGRCRLNRDGLKPQQAAQPPRAASVIASRNSSMPSPFSDEVASTDGNAAGRFLILASVSSISRGTPAAFILSVLVSTSW